MVKFTLIENVNLNHRMKITLTSLENKLLETIYQNIIQFDKKNHPAWNKNLEFSLRIQNLPLYFLIFNHCSRDSKTQSVTISHYVPCRNEMIALSRIIKEYSNNFIVCDIGCGNGFLGSLLAREGLNVFGIDDRSYKQPQNKTFYDKKCYNIINTSLFELSVPFDVAFCSWMQPNINLTPKILNKNPKILIHIFSPDIRNNGTPTTGTNIAYECPRNYLLLCEWKSDIPKNYFSPIKTKNIDLCNNVFMRNRVRIYVHKDLDLIPNVSPQDFEENYDWDIERNFINKIRQHLGLDIFSIEVS